MTRGQAHSMLLNKKISYQKYDPSVLKQNNRQEGAGRRQTTMSTVVTSGGADLGVTPVLLQILCCIF